MQSRSLCYRNLEGPDGIERKAVALATCNVRSRELFGFADRTEHDSVLTREEWRTGRQLILACFGFFRFRGNALFQERRINLPVGRRAFPGIFFPDRKSTRLNSSHTVISYAVFCLKKKNRRYRTRSLRRPRLSAAEYISLHLEAS